MADLTDVGNALVGVVADAAYPNGTGSPSVGGCDIRVFQGWPDPTQLEQDLKSGKVQVSVFPRPGDKVQWQGLGDGDWQEQSNDGTQGVAIREVRRQTRTFQITIWANCHDKRDPVASAIDSALAGIYRITLPDGSQGLMSYVSSTQDDDLQKQRIYRRDLFYQVSYATTQTVNAQTIKQVVLNTTIQKTPL